MPAESRFLFEKNLRLQDINVRNTKKCISEIRIPTGINVWNHEMNTARALATAGFVVEFLSAKDSKYTKSPDITMGGITWEMKSPKTDKLSAVERNLKRASRQSRNIIIDSQRMSKIHDSTIERYLFQKFKEQRVIERLLFVNRRRQIIDISKNFLL